MNEGGTTNVQRIGLRPVLGILSKHLKGFRRTFSVEVPASISSIAWPGVQMDLYCFDPTGDATVLLNKKRQNMTAFANLSASDLRKAADIKEQIEALQAQLNTCLDGGLTGNGGFAPARIQPNRRRDRKSKSDKTVVDCVLQATNSGNAMSIRDIISAASKIRGRAISSGLMSVTLAQLKKAKRIANPERGQYRKR